jgi:hypothetical protein
VKATSSSGFNVTVRSGLFKIRKCQKAEPNIRTMPSWIFPATKTGNDDEVLAVAYQYTIGDKVYQVGSLEVTVLMQRL